MSKPRLIRTATEHSIEIPRTARYYLMGQHMGGELWVVLHGFGQLAGDFIEVFAELNDGSRVIAAPEALNRYYTASLSVPAAERSVGATWMTKEFREVEIRDYVRYLDVLHADLTARFKPRRTIAVGFSQGGATATRWVSQGTTSVDRLVLWGALLPPDLDLAAAQVRLRRTGLTFVVGRSDQHVPTEVAAREREKLAAVGIPVDLIEYDGGHTIRRSVLAELAAKIVIG